MSFAWLDLWDHKASPASYCLCSRAFVSWLLQFCTGQADISLAVDTVGFVMVMRVRVCPLSLVVTGELAVLEPCWGLST